MPGLLGKNPFAAGYSRRAAILGIRFSFHDLHRSTILAEVGGLRPVPWVGQTVSPNSSLTDGRISTMMVNTPSTVPNGVNMHEIAAMTRQKT